MMADGSNSDVTAAVKEPVTEDGHGHHDCGTECHQPLGYKIQALDVYRAAQVGDLSRCQKLVEELGPQMLLENDERGHSALHWACLAGHNDVVRYLIQCNAPLDKSSVNELGPKPIHWACVNGHILTVDLLLQHGVSINTTDKRGCTPLIIATQYGKATLVGYLIGKGARKDFTDIDGDNALHWAAFKGHPELVQLLAYCGFNPKQKDDVGQTPMHLSCLSGNLQCVKLMVKHGVDMNVPDNNNKSPLDLAKGRKYQHIVEYLEFHLKVRNYCSFCKKFLQLFGEHNSYFFLYMLMMMGIAYPIYFYYLSFIFSKHTTANGLFVLFGLPMWFFFLRARRADPGYLPQNADEYDLALKQVSFHKEWESTSDNPLTRLCHTCRIIKPLRSKHCPICERCIDEFDHHCDFLNNCIGVKNRVPFLLYFVFLLIEMFLTDYFLYEVVREYGFTVHITILMLLAILFTPLLLWMFAVMLWQVTTNLTTNERLNAAKPNYKHLQDGSGDFRNPYDRGAVKNWLEFLHLVPSQFAANSRKQNIIMAV